MQEDSLRWQAGYDLAIGQALAAKIRAETYNMMLAMVKTQGKFDPPKKEGGRQNNTWMLQPADTVTTGSRSEKLAEKAKTYLARVVSDHPGTPWAMIAQRELEIPIGWKWRQSYTAPPRPRERPTADSPPSPPTPGQPAMMRKPPTEAPAAKSVAVLVRASAMLLGQPQAGCLRHVVVGHASSSPAFAIVLLVSRT